MGIFNFLKKKAKKQGDKIPTKLNKNNNISKLSIRPEIIDLEIRNLLWFLDGPLKNYKETEKHKTSMDFDGYTITFSFIDAIEPSAISTFLPVEKSVDNTDIEKPNYYPAYESLSPNQRWKYLTWLKNVDEKIDIGYVFLFYYGLERHLFFGDVESAFDMILKLRKKHKNNSFLSYSSDALIAASIFHKKQDWFIKLINSTSKDEIIINHIYVLAKHAINIGLIPKEIMKISKDVGFKNQRYIKNESNLFEDELKKLMLEKYESEELDLSKYKLDKCPMVEQLVLVNYSLDNKQRIIKIPSIIKNQAFSDEVFDLLQNSHDRVKEKLKELRKKGEYKPQAQKTDNKPTKKVDKVFGKSVLFNEINPYIFDDNIEYFNEGECSYCKEKLDKIPVKNGKCNHCKNKILIRNSIFTGQKLIMTEDEYNKLVDIRNERVFRNWVNKMISYEDINIKKLDNIIKSKGLTIEEGLIEIIKNNSEVHYKNSNMGLYRNSLMNIGDVYNRMKDNKKALIKYLQVCYYDIRGCMNGTKEFNKDLSFLAPYIIKSIKELADELNIGIDELKLLYINSINNLKDKPKEKNIESTWNELLEELNN